MRRRWRWELDPYTDAVDILVIGSLMWMLAGFVVWVIAMIAIGTTPRTGDMYLSEEILLGLAFTGPALAILACAFWGAHWLWDHRPRRTWESVEDLRKAKR